MASATSSAASSTTFMTRAPYSEPPPTKPKPGCEEDCVFIVIKGKEPPTSIRPPIPGGGGPGGGGPGGGGPGGGGPGGGGPGGGGPGGGGGGPGGGGPGGGGPGGGGPGGGGPGGGGPGGGGPGGGGPGGGGPGGGGPGGGGRNPDDDCVGSCADEGDDDNQGTTGSSKEDIPGSDTVKDVSFLFTYISKNVIANVLLLG